MLKNYLFTFLMKITPLAVFILVKINYYTDYITSRFETDVSSQIYDFIVVGGGSAGIVVAHRLSRHNKVLLLEAGGDPIFLQSIPSYAPGLLNQPDLDWMYSTVPQTHSGFGFRNNSILLSRGKTLGGSGSLNYGFYLRGHAQDYDNWAEITGDTNWKYENILQYFKKSILRYNGKFSKNEKQWGSNPYGFLEIEDINYNPLAQEFIHGGQQLGYQSVDVNGPQKSGFGTIQLTQKNGERYSVYSSLLKEGKQHHKNLRVLRYSLVQKIIFDKSLRAVGVRFSQHGIEKSVKASKEVIISAGSINSPQLLMLSGIGPKNHLKNIGIKSKLVDLPVGQNLQDHIVVSLPPFAISKPLSMVPIRDITLRSVVDYFWNGKGPLTGIAAFAQAFISSTKGKKYHDWPDLQLFLQGVPPFDQFIDLVQKAQGFKPEIPNEISNNFIGIDGFSILVALNRPKSVGEITLHNSSPDSHPIINPNYLQNPEDVETIIEGIKLVLNLTQNTKVFQEMNTSFSTKPITGCKDYLFHTEDYWKCYIRHVATTVWHPVGTCAMGISSAKAVVDNELRVFYTKALRVVDASVMPVIVNANTNAPTIMIAEKGADFIRQYWSQQFLICKFRDYLQYTKNKYCYYSRLV